MWFWSFLLLLQLPMAFEPPRLKVIQPIVPPVNIAGVTCVIHDLNIGPDGRVLSAGSLKGDDPLRSFVTGSAGRWIFEPARSVTPVEAHAATVFLFRPRTIFPAGNLDLSGMHVIGPDRPPIPSGLSDPGYPVNSIAEGVVVVELRLTETGAIENVRPVNIIPGLMEFTEQAVRTWTFEPALSNGVPAPGTIVVAISYLRPAVS